MKSRFHALVVGFLIFSGGCFVELQAASVEEIAGAPGIGRKTAELIRGEMDKK